MRIETIVVGLHLRWDGVWQRPNHVLTRLAKRVPVIVVEEPYLAAADTGDRDEVTEIDGVTLVRPWRRTWTDTIDATTIETVRALLGDRRPLVWLYTAQMLVLADAFPAAPLVFDKMDELTTFLGADPRIAEREPAVLRRAAVGFAGGRTLFASIAERTPNPRLYASGVDVAHFARAVRPRPRRGALETARVGYVGVLDERLDLALVAGIARARPGWTIELTGPVAKIAPTALPQAPNIHYTGKRAYDELPEILANLDAGIMPFALNEATRSISPTKTLEYLAAGLPVASTRVPDVVADYTGIVALADPPDFIAAIEAALRPDARRDERAAERVRAADWDAIAAAMWHDIERATVPARV